MSGREPPSIWWFAFGYFATYAPYSALTKALSIGALPGIPAVDGVSLLPLSTFASMVSMFLCITALGWWKYAGQKTLLGRSWPWPRWRTLASGACTALIIVTTTLAYTFEGISIVLAMLLMRGGLLVMAPVVDLLTRRKVKLPSVIALVLSLAALLLGFSTDGGLKLSAAAAMDIAVYLAAYFIRLRIMSGAAKSEDSAANTRYFVEEQMVATPLVVLVLTTWALLGSGTFAAGLHHGLVDVPFTSAALLVVGVGLFSQGTGIFGGLVLLDKRENTFTIPVNRASSILAGLVATVALWALLGGRAPNGTELGGAALILLAIGVLSADSMMKARARSAAKVG